MPGDLPEVLSFLLELRLVFCLAILSSVFAFFHFLLLHVSCSEAEKDEDRSFSFFPFPFLLQEFLPPLFPLNHDLSSWHRSTHTIGIKNKGKCG